MIQMIKDRIKMNIQVLKLFYIVIFFLLNQYCFSQKHHIQNDSCYINIQFNNMNITELPDSILIEIEQNDGSIIPIKIVQNYRLEDSTISIPFKIYLAEPMYVKNYTIITPKHCKELITIDMLSNRIEHHKNYIPPPDPHD